MNQTGVEITPPVNQADVDDIEAMMSEILPSTRAAQSTLKMRCLRRDGNRCVYSGIFDINVYNELRKKGLQPTGVKIFPTQRIRQRARDAEQGHDPECSLPIFSCSEGEDRSGDYQPTGEYFYPGGEYPRILWKI